MKHALMDILRCPTCQSSLTLSDCAEKHGEIAAGTIRCPSCAGVFPIVGYIPRLVDQENYSDSWGKLWRETGVILRDSFTGIPFHHNVIHGTYSSQSNIQEAGTSPFGFMWPVTLEGQKVLEIGAGTGNCTEHLVRTGAELTCVDMSNAIDTLPEELLIQPNINVIQADINRGVLVNEYFDRIWLFQVLQHTPSPPATLRTMHCLLKPSGELAFTSYEGQYNPWYYRFTKRINDEHAWRLINYWTPKIVPLKFWLQNVKMPFVPWLARKLLHPFDPRNMYYDTLVGTAKEYIHGVIWERTHDHDLLMKYIVLNTFDRITPAYTNSAEHATIERWARDAGFSEVETWGSGGVRAKAFK